ncbi:MAG: VWA domain-containing protein, partial [Bdellovibrionales bacterium]|nr:VWA domain-containing protein [Bdellovibrionales bacterium]NQZ19408.1 VWA domain-containing protein [Bdellovibrionales bacterium]
MRFANTSVFSLYFVVLAICIVYIVVNKRLDKKLLDAFGSKMLPFFLSRSSRFKRNLKTVLSVLCLSLMIVSYARPQFGKGKQQITSQGVELIVAVDVSRSMLAEDVKPSRLEHAKKEINHLLNILGGDKVGLLAF